MSIGKEASVLFTISGAKFPFDLKLSFLEMNELDVCDAYMAWSKSANTNLSLSDTKMFLYFLKVLKKNLILWISKSHVRF